MGKDGVSTVGAHHLQFISDDYSDPLEKVYPCRFFLQALNCHCLSPPSSYGFPNILATWCQCICSWLIIANMNLHYNEKDTISYIPLMSKLTETCGDSLVEVETDGRQGSVC